MDSLTAKLPQPLSSAFGDHNGPAGAVDDTGGLYRFNGATFVESEPTAPRLAHVAATSSGRTVAIPFPAPAASTVHVLEFSSIAAFLQWHSDPSNAAVRPTHHMLPGRPRQLVAGATFFVLLNNLGNVFTWGDGRYPVSLGRSVEGSARIPGEVQDSLGGLSVVKVAAGGWRGGAVTEGGDAFLWGSNPPSETTGRPPSNDGVEQLELPGDEDIVDIAIGDDHHLLLDGSGTVWATGSNGHGQLGHSTESYQTDLSQLGTTLSGRIRKIWCGNNTSFTLVHRD